ncbi:proteasome-associated protein ECM29 [Tanacetum coccineum]
MTRTTASRVPATSIDNTTSSTTRTPASRLSSSLARSSAVSSGSKSGTLTSSRERMSTASSQRKAATNEVRVSRLIMLPKVEIKASDDVRLDLRGHRIRSLKANGLNLSPNLENSIMDEDLKKVIAEIVGSSIQASMANLSKREIVLGEDKDKEAGKEHDKNSPIECFEGIDGQWAKVISGGYDIQQTEVGSMEKLGENGVKESGNEEVGRNMDMPNGSGNREDNNTCEMIYDKPNEDRNCLGALDMLLELSYSIDIHKDCDNKSPKCDEVKSSIIAKIVENGDPKAMGNGINISMFVRTQVESNHCESYEMSSSKVKEAFSHLIGEQNELTQELASQGLTMKLVDDTEVFQEGSIRETLSRGKLGTYKELCNLANEMGQPDLIYKFMDLANHQAFLNSKRGVAFGFSKIAKLTGDAL